MSDNNKFNNDLYAQNISISPNGVINAKGVCNFFKMEDLARESSGQVPYSRKDFYKISLFLEKAIYYYSDKVITIDKPALLFTNPMIPYKIEKLNEPHTGCFAIFKEEFFAHYGNLKEYPVFQPGKPPVYILESEEVTQVQNVFEKIETEINSAYEYKYDLIRAYLLELIHLAMKKEPVRATGSRDINANSRITSLFVDLLERQFPIESNLQRMKLRSPSDFARNLSVHINHLNRVLKNVAGKTTSRMISERVYQEAKILLSHTEWTVSEVGYCLGFEEPSHFISFFRKFEGNTPNAFRNN